MEGRELGKKLLHLRKKAALSQTEAVERLEISRQMLFWVLNFHCILLGGILLIRILHFLKTK